MAKEYIDREAAIESIEQHLLHMIQAVPLKKYEREFYTMAYQHCADVIKIVPAADVVEVRHGRWKPHSRVETPVFHCSVCGGAALHAFGKQCKSDYCPNCGAKMDKEGEA